METNDRIKTYFLPGTGELPLVAEPQEKDPLRADFNRTLAWLSENRESMKNTLHRQGAILFRGFPVNSPARFEAFVKAIDDNLMKYVGGTSDREKIEGNVYSSTTTPSYFKMALHHEMAYRAETPSKIFFYCHTAPPKDGQTIIADGRKILADIDPEIRRKFESSKVRFQRRLLNLTPFKALLARTSRMFRMISWQQVHQTSDRSRVEAILKEQGYQYEWDKSGNLTFWTSLSAIESHPETGEKVWFRPVHFFHFNPRIYGRTIYWLMRAYEMLTRSPSTRLHFENGDLADDRDISQVIDSLEKNEIYFDWKKGDVLCLDNRLIAHGRNRYRGDRKIMVLMTR